MFKRNLWIVALVAALAMVFIGCGEDRPEGGDWDLDNVTWNYIMIPGRSQGHHSIDIKASFRDNYANKDDWSEGKNHTITVWGKGSARVLEVRFSEAQDTRKRYDEGLITDNWSDGRFRLEREFTWLEITSGRDGDGGNDIRIADIAGSIREVRFYEILIVDEDDVVVYSMRADEEIQDADHGDVVLTEAGTTTRWFVGALGGGSPDPEGIIVAPAFGGFMAVTGIPEPPNKGGTGKTIALPTEANPALATNRAITWAITELGGTSASISSGTNLVTGGTPGTIKIQATVVNGTAVGTNWVSEEYDFDILPAGTALNITVGEDPVVVAVTGVQGDVEYLTDNSGYTFERAAAWEAAYAWFKLDLGSGSLAQFEKITFNYKGLAGDVTFKNALLVAGNSAAEAGGSAGNVSAGNLGQTTQIAGTVGVSYPVSITINSAKAATFTGEVFISIYVNANITGGTTIEFSDIEFVLGELCEDCDKFPCECACDVCGENPCECPKEPFSWSMQDITAFATAANGASLSGGAIIGPHLIDAGAALTVVDLEGTNGIKMVLASGHGGWRGLDIQADAIPEGLGFQEGDIITVGLTLQATTDVDSVPIAAPTGLQAILRTKSGGWGDNIGGNPVLTVGEREELVRTLTAEEAARANGNEGIRIQFNGDPNTAPFTVIIDTITIVRE